MFDYNDNYKINLFQVILTSALILSLNLVTEKNDRSIGQTLVNISTVDENQQRLINIKEYLKTVNIRIHKMILML